MTRINQVLEWLSEHLFTTSQKLNVVVDRMFPLALGALLGAAIFPNDVTIGLNFIIGGIFISLWLMLIFRQSREHRELVKNHVELLQMALDNNRNRLITIQESLGSPRLSDLDEIIVVDVATETRHLIKFPDITIIKDFIDEHPDLATKLNLNREGANRWIIW